MIQNGVHLVIDSDRLNVFFRLACVASLVSLGACVSTGDTIAASECPIPANQLEEYTIGPGDTLQIVIWRNEELSTTVPVRPDGRISTPLVDDIQAAGRTPTQLASDMENILAEYLRSPDVSIIVTGQGASNQIQVVGEVGSPQSLSYRANLRVLDVLVASGGLSDFAAGNRATIVRLVETGQVRCLVRLNDLMSGDMSQNIQVYSGDVLIIPEARF